MHNQLDEFAKGVILPLHGREFETAKGLPDFVTNEDRQDWRAISQDTQAGAEKEVLTGQVEQLIDYLIELQKRNSALEHEKYLIAIRGQSRKPLSRQTNKGTKK